MTTLALWLLPIAALACWRWSRLVAGALAFAFGAALLYRYAWQWEGLRWVSAVTGLAGIVELWERNSVVAEACRCQGAAFGWQVRTLRPPRSDVLAILLVGSSAADAAALLWWRATSEWGPLPFFQVVVLLAMMAVSLWPRRLG